MIQMILVVIKKDFMLRMNKGFYVNCFDQCKRGALTTTTPGVDLTIQHPRQIPIGNRNFPPYINKFLTTFELKQNLTSQTGADAAFRPVIHSSAIQITTTMDKNIVPATSTETVANANAEVVNATINRVSCFTRNIIMKDCDKEVKVIRTFVAINDEPATALENISFGKATPTVRIAEKLFGVDAVDVVVSVCLGCSAKFVIDGEFITNVIIDDVDVSAAKDALATYREMNA